MSLLNHLIKKICHLNLFIFLLGFSVNAFADNNKIKEQQLMIEINSESCPIYVRNDSPSNCQEMKKMGEGNPCKNKIECVCSKKQKYISWKADKNKRFEVTFLAGSPFKNKCELKSKDTGEIRCKIHNKGEFEYEVKVEGCEDKPYDPKIIVK